MQDQDQELTLADHKDLLALKTKILTSWDKYSDLNNDITERDFNKIVKLENKFFDLYKEKCPNTEYESGQDILY